MILIVMECKACRLMVATLPAERPASVPAWCIGCEDFSMSVVGWYHDLKPGSHPEIPRQEIG